MNVNKLTTKAQEALQAMQKYAQDRGHQALDADHLLLALINQRVEKDPRLARKQGAYSVIAASGQILRRGHELDRVLLVIDRKLELV